MSWSFLNGQSRIEEPSGWGLRGLCSGPHLRKRCLGVTPGAVYRGGAVTPLRRAEELLELFFDLRRSASERSSQDDDPDGDVVADRCGRGERMKELVIAEGLWPRVGPAKAVKDSADVVKHTFGDE